MPIATAAGQGFLIGRNATVVCLGDSITEYPEGYVTVMRNLLAAAYPERNLQIVNAGVGGNKAPDMLARLQRDVIARKPDWVTINVGINDVWHGFYDFAAERACPEGNGPGGVSLEEYTQALTLMVDALREATDAQIVLLTPTVIGEDVDNPENIANRKLEGYVEAMRRVAEAHSTYLAPTHEDCVRAIRAGKAANPDYRLTTDGVHMNPVGNFVMALSVLYTLGFGTV
ncbi:MAG TPA: SGNH/GDSL hydrolase family protein [Chthonomonadaceae bacterium]|nr:SGNH/GDSL hydrolase family protein [Chthonomonadaceae bacterium]